MRFARCILLLATTVVITPGPFVAAQTLGDDIVIGRSIRLQSAIYRQEIELSVYLPRDYERSDDRYPVLYSVHSRFLHNAGAVAELSGIHMPPLMYVHIDSYDSGDLIPTAIESRPGSGGADRLIAFFREELIPSIDANFRTQPFRALQSGSWGGVFALYTLLTQPDVFDAYLASTPWLIYDEDEKFMLNNAERWLAAGEFDNEFVFLALGNDSDPGLRESVDSLARLLHGSELRGLKFHYVVWEDEDHASTPHKALYDGLRWTFRDWAEVPNDVILGGIDAITRYADGLGGTYGFDIGIHPRSLSQEAQRHIREGDFEGAVELLALAVELSPGIPYLHARLGQAYERANQLEVALRHFERAHELAVVQRHPDVSAFADYITRVRRRLAGRR
jgi:predicted alpha/beta superfamily hydrolase